MPASSGFAPAQLLIMLVAAACFVALLVAPALDRRYGWSPTSTVVSIAGDALVAAGFMAIFLVYRENSFAAATNGLAEVRKVISTGPTHWSAIPCTPAGSLTSSGRRWRSKSWWGLAPLAAMAPFLVGRLLDEERLLTSKLAGYRESMGKVRYRLLPGAH